MAKIRYAELTGNARLDSFLRRHVDELNAELSLISRGFEKSVKELTEKVEKTAEVPAVIREKVTQHSQQIGALTESLKGVQNRLDVIDKLIEAQNSTIQGLDGEITTLRLYYSRLEERIAALE